MADSNRPRGRARGRARPADQGQQNVRPGGPRGPTPSVPQQPQGAWGPRPGGGPRPQVIQYFINE